MAVNSMDVTKTSWLDEIRAAFRTLGGVARYEDLYEYIHRTTDRELTPEWKATVRRTIEDHSSDSRNFRGKDIFRYVDHGLWCLRDAADADEVRALAKARSGRNSKHVVDEVLVDKTDEHIQEPKVVFIHEHWRRWPTKKDSMLQTITIDPLRFTIVDGWVTDQYLELKLSSGICIKTPLEWYPKLLSAPRNTQRQVEIGDYGVHWPAIGLQVLVPDILSASHMTQPKQKEA